MKSPGRVFGQDLMRGEHVVGGGHLKGTRLRPNKDPAVDRTLPRTHPTYGGAEQVLARGEEAAPSTGTSIFDPVLCELVYRWFCPPGGHVLDPFAGGSVRGVVASKLGRKYVGIDLRPEQVEANEKQARAICGDPMPRWIVGDSFAPETHAAIADVRADLIFSCPPYGDLEVYSDDPRDLSAMSYEDFLIAYRGIVAAAIERLADDRFAVFVVGDFRSPDGLYRNFPAETIEAFRRAGASLYNDAILVTAVGSLPIRAGKSFTATRKLGKTHQNVLVFVKGDPVAATEACGQVEIAADLLHHVDEETNP